jgi:hypothetical protein
MSEFNLSKVFIVIGVVFIGIGLVLIAAHKLPWLGRLPGDFYYKKESFTFYFPFATCLVISLIITLIMRLLRK